MNFTETPLPGAYVIDLEPRRDDRGFFARAWCRSEFAEQGIDTAFVQANLAGSARKGTLRGMHYQKPPHGEAKLVRCIKGRLFDVMVDLRPDSSTYLKWFGVELSAANQRMAYVPASFAHGYLTLEDDTEAFYQVSAFYAPGAEGGFRWNDPAVGIQWPITQGLVISEKDRSWQPLSV